MKDWPEHIAQAFRSGHVPEPSSMAILARKVARLQEQGKTRLKDHLTVGEQVVWWAHTRLVVPEGKLVGRQLELDPFQICFILAVFDSPDHVNEAILSIARRNGKSFLIAVILLAYIVGPLSRQNTKIASAANSRDQAALVFSLMEKMLRLSPKMEGKFRIIPSKKTIIGLDKNVEYAALSADAKTGHGQSLYVLLLDEAGQVKGPNNDYIDMLRTSQGSYDDARFFTVSTQSASDADFLSIMIDNATRTPRPGTVCHVYEADKGCHLLDEDQWRKANPGLDVFRSSVDLERQLKDALDLPSQEAGARNLLLNQRVDLQSLLISPTVWRDNNGQPDELARRKAPIHIGIDLSLRTDLTAAVAAWKNDFGEISVETNVFAPLNGVKQREIRDRAPYSQWAKEGHLHLVPGDIVELGWVCEFLAQRYAGCQVASVQYDAWRMNLFMESAKLTPFYEMVGQWEEVRQGYLSMSPRIEALEAELLARRIRHGSHPLLNMAASHAVSVADPAGNRKVDKSKSTQRIDPLVAALMAIYPLSEGSVDETFDAAAFVG